jgi:hypothetical protein
LRRFPGIIILTLQKNKDYLCQVRLVAKKAPMNVSHPSTNIAKPTIDPAITVDLSHNIKITKTAQFSNINFPKSEGKNLTNVFLT